MKIKSQKDFFSGLMFTVVGAAFALGATTYTVGTGARMGPGYFPLLLGILLAILGATILFNAMVVETPDGDKIGKWAWRPLSFIILANVLFGVMLGGLPSIGLPAMGMILGIYALTIVASMADERLQAQGSAGAGDHPVALAATWRSWCCSSCSSRCGRLSSRAEADTMRSDQQPLPGFWRGLHGPEPDVLPSSAACWAR